MRTIIWLAITLWLMQNLTTNHADVMVAFLVIVAATFAGVCATITDYKEANKQS